MAEEFNINDYLLGLQKIGAMYNVDSSLKRLSNKEGLKLEDRVRLIQGLGQTIQGNPDFLKNETDVAVGNEAMHYQETGKNGVEEAVKAYKGRIAEDYVGVINENIAANLDKTKTDIEKNKDYQKLDGDKKKIVLEQSLREVTIGVIKQFLSDLKLNKDYKEDEELVDAYNLYNTLKDNDDQNDIVGMYVNEHNLSSNAVNNTFLKNNYKNLKKENLEVYASVVASKLLDKDGKVDAEKLGKAFDSVDSYKAMSPYVAQKYSTRE